MDPEENETLTEEQILSEGLLVEAGEARVVVPTKGKVFEEDGTCKIAIIRPCVSRGRRIRGLPPIYSPTMLAENAQVFTGWLMYMDHLTERIVEMLQERGRSIRELGGRVTKSWYDPEFVAEYDEDYGYVKGAIVGRALPQPAIRSMLEADPDILHVSINAYPTGVKAGNPPWAPAVKGMLIEGIRAKPEGSVDWVPRGGAGGRVLKESEEQMIGLLETYYGGLAVTPRDPGYDLGEMKPDFTKMTRTELLESLRSDNPDLARELGLSEDSSGTPTTAAPPAASTALPALTEAALEEKLAERDALWEGRLRDKDVELEERAAELLSEREQARSFERIAHGMIEKSGLKAAWQADLKRRYSILPSGPTVALMPQPLMEGDGQVAKTAEEVLRESVKADLEHAAELIAESTGRRPTVTGLGGGNAGAEKTEAPRRSAFRDFLRESGDKLEGDGALDLKTMVAEGVRD